MFTFPMSHQFLPPSITSNLSITYSYGKCVTAKGIIQLGNIVFIVVDKQVMSSLYRICTYSRSERELFS